jgi:hypothetical protein
MAESKSGGKIPLPSMVGSASDSLYSATETYPLQRSSSVKTANFALAVPISLLALLLWSAPALSNDTDPIPGDDASEYLDRDLLTDTLMRDDVPAVEAAAEARDAAQEALDEAIAAGAEQDVIDELEMQRDAAEEALTEQEEAFAAERDTIEMQVGEMSDDQVIAMNESLHNTLHNGLVPVISSDDLMRVLDGNYNAEQIEAFTKAYEAEASFVAKSDKFEAKYDATGKEQFLRNADRFDAKAATEKAKFLGKVDRLATPDDDMTPPDPDPSTEALISGEMHTAAQEAARDLARDTARDAQEEARRFAKGAGQAAAKDSASDVAKAAAKGQAREEAKQLAKTERGNQGHGLAKGMDN